MNNISIFDVMYPKFILKKPIRLIELFAGVGSQAMALRNLGMDFEHHRVVEFEKYAILSYNAIHGTDFPTHDITEFKGEDLGIEEVDEYDYIMTYSFPCQDLSVAGNMKGMSRDSGTRSGLLWEVERLLNETKELPQVLLMENVPQVIAEDNLKDFHEWVRFLEDKGYQNYVEKLNAKDYGVAQNRNRAFMVSILGEYSYNFPQKIQLKKTMKDYLEDEVDEKFYIDNEKARQLIEWLVDGDLLENSCIGNINPSGNRMNGNVFSVESESPTLTTNKGEGLKIMVAGYLDEGFKQNNVVLNTSGLCKCIDTMGGGNREPKIVASRGRNKINPSDRTSGAEVEQRLEPNSQGICNTITSVQKDNLVLEPISKKEILGSIYTGVSEKFQHGIMKNTSRCLKAEKYDTGIIERNTVKIKQATDPTLTASETGICKIESEYRIRKLTPLECWRLMGFTDEDFSKAEKVNSNSQLYRQSGNSIVVQVLEAIFKQMASE